MLENELQEISKSARIKMAQRMKKLAPKLARKRAMAAKKMAGSEQLKKRAEKAAKTIIMNKLTKGIDKSTLSDAQKNKIEKAMRKKAGAIKKIAKKLYPKVKQKEKERMAKVALEKR
jgi:energy-converting hydrogenase A subunit M